MPHIFLHIPKTGGTTLGYVFRRTLRDQYFDDARERRENRRAFAKLSEEEQAAYEIVRGHFMFGYHHRLKGDGDARYLSMVRNPTRRVMSLHKHIQRVEEHPLHEKVKDVGITEFVNEGYEVSVDNGQVRALSGFTGEYGTVGPEQLQQALDNIEALFPIVGVLEEFDTSLRLMTAALGWKSVPKYKTRNEAPPSQNRALSAEEVAVIDQMNGFDHQLFEEMTQRLARQAEELPSRRSWRS